MRCNKNQNVLIKIHLTSQTFFNLDQYYSILSNVVLKSFLQISFKEIKQSPKLFPIKKRYKIAKSGLVVILTFDSIHKFNIGV